MRSVRSGTLPAASSCVTTFLLATIFFSIVSSAAPSPVAVPNRERRQHAHSHEHAHDSPATTADDNPNISAPSAMSNATNSTTAPLPPNRHGHNHGSHTEPKYVLDDVDIHFWHKFPPSYLAADFRLDNDSAIFGEEFDETWDPDDASGHRGLVILHALGFYTAYFGLMPVALALRAAQHPYHYLANAMALVSAVLGWIAGATYNSATPNRYEGSIYPKFVNILLGLSLVLFAIDSVDLIKRAVSFWKNGKLSWRSFASHVLRDDNRKEWLDTHNRYEMVGIDGDQIHEEPEHAVFAVGDDEDENTEEIDKRPIFYPAQPPSRPILSRRWSPPSRNSTGSDGTLHDSPMSPQEGFGRKHQTRAGAFDARPDHSGPSEAHLESGIWTTVQTLLTWLRRFQVVFAYITLLAGLTTYTGMCRGSYVNSCAAHYVKGSIFFGYGLLTFGRYLGAYADLGWAWNRRPDSIKGPSAEMIECSIIFVYGITNTWMERFGAGPNDPYTVKQVQHISIAVMFWFAGLSGILLESKTVRRILATVNGRSGDVAEPPSYAFSFNPLPALVIAVTGLAMAAHHQNYVFQVEVHKLWGILLAGGSMFRFITYFFLWLRPPTESTLPSRPPSELLTSFGYAAGGIVFMLSNEEIAFAAMRAGYDDMMAFLNFTVALTSLIFCWAVVVMAIKGWGVMRGQKRTEVDSER